MAMEYTRVTLIVNFTVAVTNPITTIELNIHQYLDTRIIELVRDGCGGHYFQAAVQVTLVS